jgi:hypothetical protein
MRDFVFLLLYISRYLAMRDFLLLGALSPGIDEALAVGGL